MDVFSKFAYAVPLKNKMSASIIAGFKKLLKQSGRFTKLQTNRGSEFLSEQTISCLVKEKRTRNFSKP